MSAGVKLGGFGLVLAASLGVGLAAGAVAGPIDTDDHPPAVSSTPSSVVDEEEHGHGG
jgi:hypothetical protein